MRFIYNRFRVFAFSLVVGLSAVVFYFIFSTSVDKFKVALELYRRWDLVGAEKVLEKFADKDNLASYHLYGQVLFLRGELKKARDVFRYLSEVNSIYRYDAMLKLAHIYYFMGKIDSLKFYVGLFLSSGVPDSVLISRAYNILGLGFFYLAKYDSAYICQMKSYEIASSINSAKETADALRQLGVLYWYDGRVDTAIYIYQKALKLYREVDDKIGEATTLSDIGLAYADKGELEINLKYQLKAFGIRKEIGDLVGLADSYFFLSRLPIQSDAVRSYACSYLIKSVKLSERIGYQWGREVAIRSLMQMLGTLFDEFGISGIGKSWADSIDFVSGEGRVYITMGKVNKLMSEGKFEEALKVLEKIYQGFDTMKVAWWSKWGMFLTRVNILAKLGKLNQAIREIEESEGKTENIMVQRAFKVSKLVDYHKAIIYWELGKHRKALNILSKLADYVDSIYVQKFYQFNPEISIKVALSLIYRFRLSIYRSIIKMLFELKDPRIFYFIERERNLPFWSGYDDGGGDYETKSIKVFRNFARKLAIYDKGSDDVKLRELLALSGELYRSMLLEHKIVKGFGLTGYNSKVTDISKLQSHLNNKEAFIEYFMGDSSLYILVVRNNLFDVLEVKTTPSDMKAIVEIFRNMILRGRRYSSDMLWFPSSYRLYSILIYPVVKRGLIRDGDRLIISPYGVLSLVPFSALVTSDGRDFKFLVEEYFISYSPSATHFVKLRSRRLNSIASVLAVAPETDELPFTLKEINSIAEINFAYVKLLRNIDATVGAVLGELNLYDVIHISSHAKVNYYFPLHSYIQLADGRLELYEILRRKIDARLVVLSACETGVGVEVVDGLAGNDNFVSFARAFISAGADAVITSLWVVEDKSSFLIMKYFYENLFENKEDLTSSLNLAEREIIRKARERGEVPHPFFWAPFVLTGE